MIRTGLLKITLFSLVLLSSLLPLEAGTPHADSLRADSLLRHNRCDSLMRLVEARKGQYDRKTDNDGNAYTTTTRAMFDGNAITPSEALRGSPFCVPIRFGLSNRMNRFLLWGNPAPITPIFSLGTLIPTTFGELAGTDNSTAAEFSSISLPPDGSCAYSLYPAEAIVPEAFFLWENGVFGENVLDLRFMRAVTDRITINVFSTYRHFDNTQFNHNGNSINTFYQSTVPDTSLITNAGNNPLTEEYSAGAQVRWRTVGNANWYLGFKYTDCGDDLALDSSDANGFPAFSRLHQFRSAIDLGQSENRFGILSLDFGAHLEKDNLSRSDTGSSLIGASNTDLSFAARGGMHLSDSAVASLLYRITDIDRSPFARGSSRSIAQTPEFSLTLPVRSAPLGIVATGAIGYMVYSLNDSLAYTPTWSLGATAHLGAQEVRLYARTSALPYDIPYESALFIPGLLLDVYHTIGAEVALKASGAGLVLGCQSVSGVDSMTVRRAWPLGVAPYEQPHATFLLAPSFGPWHGFTLQDRAMLTDSRPTIKNEASLSFLNHPEDTREYIDAKISYVYWSHRDNITYAGDAAWSREVNDLDFELAAHVRTFRFFAKIDNLLDRKLDYVPGYYSPGLTFRWGIAWYLQR